MLSYYYFCSNMRRLFYITAALLFFLAIHPMSHAQNLKIFDPSKNAPAKPPKTKQKLATELYAAGEYSKATPLFEELYESNNSSFYYRYLLYCYVQLEDYKKAEKLIKKASRESDKAYKELADLGYIQLQKGESEKSEKLFEKSIKILPADKAAVNELANDFRSRGQAEWAEKTYFAGQELLNGAYGFESELGYLYYYLEQYDKMTDSYLDLLAVDANQMRVIQYRIQNAFRRASEEEIYPYLKNQLLNRIKKDPDQAVYSELLLWLSIQRQDFKIAMIQAKALDQKSGSEYFRVFDLAQLMLNHGEYEQSVKALEFITSKSTAKDQVYYPEARQALLSAKYGRLSQQETASVEQIETLSAEFKEMLDELGRFRFTIPSVMEYAQLLYFYENKADSAVAELENLIEHPGINKMDQAPIKLLLGDIYLLNENPWEATLLYSQVEKDFKNDEIGFESRLKNAKLSFYIGEFDWSRAQLDILKAATNKKIANDAMNLSLFISENLDADSNTRALELYGRADLLFLRNENHEAIQTLDSIFMLSLYHEVFDDVWFRQSEIWMKIGNLEKARQLLEKIVDQYPDALLADDAIWKLAEMEQDLFLEESKAADWYKKILTDYPSSFYSTEARERFRKIRQDFPENEKADSL